MDESVLGEGFASPSRIRQVLTKLFGDASERGLLSIPVEAGLDRTNAEKYGCDFVDVPIEPLAEYLSLQTRDEWLDGHLDYVAKLLEAQMSQEIPWPQIEPAIQNFEYAVWIADVVLFENDLYEDEETYVCGITCAQSGVMNLLDVSIDPRSLRHQVSQGPTSVVKAANESNLPLWVCHWIANCSDEDLFEIAAQYDFGIAEDSVPMKNIASPTHDDFMNESIDDPDRREEWRDSQNDPEIAHREEFGWGKSQRDSQLSPED